MNMRDEVKPTINTHFVSRKMWDMGGVFKRKCFSKWV
jgi:hypothetical protein